MKRDVNKLSFVEALPFFVVWLVLLVLAWHGMAWLLLHDPAMYWAIVFGGIVVYPACCVVIGLLGLLFR